MLYAGNLAFLCSNLDKYGLSTIVGDFCKEKKDFKLSLTKICKVSSKYYVLGLCIIYLHGKISRNTMFCFLVNSYFLVLAVKISCSCILVF